MQARQAGYPLRACGGPVNRATHGYDLPRRYLRACDPRAVRCGSLRSGAGSDGHSQPLQTADQHRSAATVAKYCCQATGRRPTHVDNSGISAQLTIGDGRSWTTCPLLWIRCSTKQPRARCVPDRTVIVGYSRSLAQADEPADLRTGRLTRWANRPSSSGSQPGRLGA